MNVLHLISDEKFFSFVSKVFNALPGVTNRYVAHVRDRTTPLNHIGEMKLWRVVGRTYFFSPNMTRDLDWCDCLLIHCLSTAGARMILKAPQRVTVVWSAWGTDYYSFLADNEQSLLGDETRQILAAISNGGSISKHVKRGREKLRNYKRQALTKGLLLPSIERVDLFSAPIPDDFDGLRSALGARFRADYVQLNYGSVEHSFQPGPEWVTGNDILIGNSGAVTNNHADVFRALSEKKFPAQKFIVPLSYGYSSHQGYREAVLSLGQALLGPQFSPILKFMSLHDYNAVIARCSTVIMNQRRQQAVGNIGAMLFKGAKLFLDERNSAFSFLRNRGACVFSMKDLNRSLDHAFVPLAEDERQKNRQVLRAFWDHDVVVSNATRFAQLVTERGRRSV